MAELEECARAQGVTFRRGDILLLRIGFIQKYYTVTTEERDALGGRPETSYVFFLRFGYDGVADFVVCQCGDRSVR